MPKIIFSHNPIMEALKSEKPPEKIYVLHGTRGVASRDIVEMATEKRIPIEQVGRLRFKQLGATKHSQGVAALISEYDFYTVEQILKIARKRNEPPVIALLSNIENPMNLGAIIRSAECAGVHGIVIPKHRAVGITESVATSSAGAMAHIAIARVTNLANAIEELKAAGIWIAGADQDGEKLYYETDFTGPTGIVIGSEGKGIRRLVKEKCDFLVKIPNKGQVNSLNASVAAGIMFFEIVRQRELSAENDEVPMDDNPDQIEGQVDEKIADTADENHLNEPMEDNLPQEEIVENSEDLQPEPVKEVEAGDEDNPEPEQEKVKKSEENDSVTKD